MTKIGNDSPFPPNCGTPPAPARAQSRQQNWMRLLEQSQSTEMSATAGPGVEGKPRLQRSLPNGRAPHDGAVDFGGLQGIACATAYPIRPSGTPESAPLAIAAHGIGACAAGAGEADANEFAPVSRSPADRRALPPAHSVPWPDKRALLCATPQADQESPASSQAPRACAAQDVAPPEAHPHDAPPATGPNLPNATPSAIHAPKATRSASAHPPVSPSTEAADGNGVLPGRERRPAPPLQAPSGDHLRQPLEAAPYSPRASIASSAIPVPSTSHGLPAACGAIAGNSPQSPAVPPIAPSRTAGGTFPTPYASSTIATPSVPGPGIAAPAEFTAEPAAEPPAPHPRLPDADGTEASPNWRKRLVHVTGDGNEIELWIRDKALARAQAALLVERMAAEASAMGMHLSGATLNGKPIFHANDRQHDRPDGKDDAHSRLAQTARASLTDTANFNLPTTEQEHALE